MEAAEKVGGGGGGEHLNPTRLLHGVNGRGRGLWPGKTAGVGGWGLGAATGTVTCPAAEEVPSSALPPQL